MKIHHLVPFAAMIGALSLFGLGCNPVASLQQKAGEKVAAGIIGAATGGKVDLNSQNKGVQFKDNKTGDVMVYGEDVKLPDTFPKDVPIFSGSKISEASISGNGKNATVGFSVPDAMATIVSFYADTLTKDGWKESQSMTEASAEIRGYEKGNAKLSVTITSDSERAKGSTVMITRSEN